MRDFIVKLLEYALLDNLLKKLKRAKPNKENILSVHLDSYDLAQLIKRKLHMPDIKYTHENKEIILARIKELIERNNFIDAHNMLEALDVDNILLQRLPGKHDHNDLKDLLENNKKELCEEIKAQKYLVTKSPKLSRLKETKNEILPSRQISVLMGGSPKIVKCKPDDKIFRLFASLRGITKFGNLCYRLKMTKI